MSVAQHRSGSCFTSKGVATIPPRVHHEERDIAITKVKVMQSRTPRIVIGVPVVNAERVFSVREGRCVIGLTDVIVDKLPTQWMTLRKALIQKGISRTSWSSYA